MGVTCTQVLTCPPILSRLRRHDARLRRTGHEGCRANEGGERASERDEASGVKDEEMADAAPPHRTSPP